MYLELREISIGLDPVITFRTAELACRLSIGNPSSTSIGPDES